MTTPTIDGLCDPRFERVREAFAENFAKHSEIGASVAICIDGRSVVDLWGGFANEARLRSWQQGTLVNAFSVGKGVTALALLLLVDRGLVDLDAAVARYWPEFAAAGKDVVTVRQLLSHQAGLPAVRESLGDDAIYDWHTMTAALARQAPWWAPGSRHGYHVNTFGFLVGEIVRRVSGKSVGAFLREEISGPVGADFHIGVADSQHERIAEFVWLPELAILPDPDLSTLTDEQRMMLLTYFNPRGASGHGTVNTTAWRRAEIPSTNCHATALGVARVYSLVATGGLHHGATLVGRSILEEAAREQAAGVDAILGRPTRFGLGFQLAPKEKALGPNAGVVQHYGAGGALGFADPVAKVGFGYVMNRMGPRYNNPTNRGLVDALYACL